MKNIKFKNTITSITTDLQNGNKTALEVVEESFKAVDESADLNIFLYTNKEAALKKANELDALSPEEKLKKPLLGVPLVLKDNIVTRGIPTTCASQILKDWKPPYNATVVDRLNEAGAVLIGKANLDEFAMGSSTENSSFGMTKNPWDETKVPGGSSGGSAVAVAAGVSPLALGSDTGGSIRQPGSFCGVVGFKPSYGRISRYGLIAFGSSLDQIGPFTNTVEDTAIAFSVMAGKDPYDSTSSNLSVPSIEEIRSTLGNTDLSGKKIGIIKELQGEGYDEEVLASIDYAKEVIEAANGEVVEISIPNIKHCLSVYYILSSSEASSNLSRFDGVRYGHRSKDPEADIVDKMNELTRYEGFGEEVKRRIIIGTYALSTGHYDEMYGQAQRVRRMIYEEMKESFKDCAALLCPTSPILPFTAGEKTDDPLAMYLSDVCTFPANLAGMPGISVPVKLSKSGLPIGMQLIANNFDELNLFQVANALEEGSGFLELRRDND
jgi:aspartyl-tRNA(Asn)/glutamyl-tRNA(Gln) amidotransferase subunit A